MTRNRMLVALSLVAGLVAGNAEARIKCWTSHDGVRECGNTVPPEFAQQQNETLNQHGQTIGVQQRARTAAELAEESRQRETAEQRYAEERRRREEQARHDQVLLATFVTEQDIAQAYERKVSAVEGAIELTRLGIDKLEGQLADYQKRAAHLEGNNRPVPADLTADMTAVQQQINNRNAYLTTRRDELLTLRRDYERDLARFRELKINLR